MAFASIGSIGSAQSGTDNLASLAITTTAAAEAGNYVVVIIAVDNHEATDGETTAVSSVTNSGTANTWVKLKEYTNGSPGTIAGATCSMWGSLITTTIASGGTITANFTNATSRDAAAMTAWEFSVAGGVTITVAGSNTFDGSSVTMSFDVITANIQHLRLVGTATEDNSTNQLQLSGFDLAMTANQTAGGGAAVNMCVRGNFSVLTGTTLATVFVDGPNGDCAAVYVALKETSIVPASLVYNPAAYMTPFLAR